MIIGVDYTQTGEAGYGTTPLLRVSLTLRVSNTLISAPRRLNMLSLGHAIG